MYTHLTLTYVYVCALCAGDSQEFTVVVTPNENAPLDLYILMDLSASMETNLETVQQISNQIGEMHT